MAWLRHRSPSQVIQGLPFYQVAGKLVTKTNKKITRDGNPVLVRKVDWARFYFIMKTQKKIHLKIHRKQTAASNRINNIQSIQIRWIYQVVVEIYFFFQAVEHFAICAYRARWDLGSEIWSKAKKKNKTKRWRNCACVHKTSSVGPSQITSLYWIQIKVQVSLMSYLDLLAHHASQKHMHFYWLPPSTLLYSVLFAALLHWFLLPKSHYWFSLLLFHVCASLSHPADRVGKVWD